MSDILRIQRGQLNQFIDDYEVIRQIEALFDAVNDLRLDKILEVPTTGFDISFNQNGTNQWLVLNPSLTLASGTINLVAPSVARDLQEVQISTTMEVSALIINGNGGTVYGAPSVLNAEKTLVLRYDSSLTGWFVVP